MLNMWKKMKHLQKAVVKKRDFQMILNTSGLSGRHDFELHILLDFSDFRVQPYKTSQTIMASPGFPKYVKCQVSPLPFTAMNYLSYVCSEVVHRLFTAFIGGSFPHCLL